MKYIAGKRTVHTDQARALILPKEFCWQMYFIILIKP